MLLGLFACASHPVKEEPLFGIHALDSLNRVAEHNDSVEANLYFYEEAYATYRERYPGVDKPTFMTVARGKDQAFCLFQNDPANLCLNVGDKFNNLGLKEPARDAYEAGLVSEGYNDGKINVRLWSSLAQLHYESGEKGSARAYLTKVLEVEPGNKWAKKMMAQVARKPEG